jgi:hypothetical protein
MLWNVDLQDTVCVGLDVDGQVIGIGERMGNKGARRSWLS